MVFRPPPGRRCRSPTSSLSAGSAEACNSRLPCRMVLGLMASASATARTPPVPNASASLAAHNLVPRSPKWGRSRSNFSRTDRFPSSRTFQYSRSFSCFPPCQSWSATCWDPPFLQGLPLCFISISGSCPALTAVWELIYARLLSLGISQIFEDKHLLSTREAQ